MYVFQILVISYQFQHISSKKPSILKTLHYSEGHHHLKEEASCRMGGTVFGSYTSDRELVSRKYKELKNETKQDNNPIKKNIKRGMVLNRILL